MSTSFAGSHQNTPPLADGGNESSLLRKMVNAAAQVASAVLPRTPTKTARTEEIQVTANTTSPAKGHSIPPQTTTVKLSVSSSGNEPVSADGEETLYPPHAVIKQHASSASQAKSAVDRRKSKQPWTASEELLLIEGINKFGVGSWTKILKELQFPSYRTSTDLKDKYRNIQIREQKTALIPASSVKITDVARIEVEEGKSEIGFMYSYGTGNTWYLARTDIPEWGAILESYAGELSDKYSLIQEAIAAAKSLSVPAVRKEAANLIKNESLEDVFHETRSSDVDEDLVITDHQPSVTSPFQRSKFMSRNPIRKSKKLRVNPTVNVSKDSFVSAKDESQSADSQLKNSETNPSQLKNEKIDISLQRTPQAVSSSKKNVEIVLDVPVGKSPRKDHSQQADGVDTKKQTRSTLSKQQLKENVEHKFRTLRRPTRK